MIHLRAFETQAGFEAAKGNLVKPWVSLTTENNNVYYSSSESVTEANLIMISIDGYQLYGEDFGDGQITYFKFEYVGTREYEGKEYYEYSFMGEMSILAPTRNITKVTFPFEDYYTIQEGEIIPSSYIGVDSVYGFTEEPTNKVIMQHRTDIGTNANGHDYVDLGLTSGTLWATMNVGAESATQYGKYFQWGDTVGFYDNKQHDFSWDTYKYGDGDNFTKYNTGFNDYGGTIDNKLVLDLSDDAVRANMGGDWKMPTIAQLSELINATTHEWVDDYKGTGINGRLFTSKSNGNTIFIPASGYRWGTSVLNQGGRACLWSSSLSASDPGGAWGLSFRSGDCGVNIDGRDGGFCLRGVL